MFSSRYSTMLLTYVNRRATMRKTALPPISMGCTS